MNLRGLQDYFTSGKGVSVGSPNEASAYKLPQLNTAQITGVSFNALITATAASITTICPQIPFYLTDRNPDGVPYVKCEQAKGSAVDMTLLTFTKLPFLVTNTADVSMGSLKLLTPPKGRIAYNGGTLIFTEVNWATNYSFVQTTGVAGTVMTAGGSGDFSLGTTIPTSAATGQVVSTPSTGNDIVAKTALIDPFVAGVGNNLATPGAVLNGPTEFNNSTTAAASHSVFLNIQVDSGDATATNANVIFLTGYLRLYTSWLGDF